MATLETAFELHGVARNIIASQSLLPYGSLKARGDVSVGLWDYATLFKHLNKPKALAEALCEFYKNPNNRGDDVSIPVSRLKLSAVEKLANPLKLFVDALSEPAAEPVRKAAFGPKAYIYFPPAGPPKAGSDDLVDFPTVLRTSRRSRVPIRWRSSRKRPRSAFTYPALLRCRANPTLPHSSVH